MAYEFYFCCRAEFDQRRQETKVGTVVSERQGLQMESTQAADDDNDEVHIEHPHDDQFDPCKSGKLKFNCHESAPSP